MGSTVGTVMEVGCVGDSGVGVSAVVCRGNGEFVGIGLGAGDEVSLGEGVFVGIGRGVGVDVGLRVGEIIRVFVFTWVACVV